MDRCVVWLPGLGRLGKGMDAEVVSFTCCMARFKAGSGHLLLEDVYWDCFRGAQGLVDRWIALVCFE